MLLPLLSEQWRGQGPHFSLKAGCRLVGSHGQDLSHFRDWAFQGQPSAAYLEVEGLLTSRCGADENCQ